MSNILNTEFDTNEEDPSFEPTTEPSQDDLEEKSQEENEKDSIDMDQIPVGKVKFTLDGNDAEALVYANEDVKVTTINEMECNDTLDEDDFLYNPEKDEDLEKNKEEENIDCMNCINKEEEHLEMNSQEDEDLDQDDCCDNEENEFEVVKQKESKDENGENLHKLKFKDVEQWKLKNSEKEAEDAVSDDEEQESKSKEEGEIQSQEEQEIDEDYNPIYNDETLSDVEEPEDENDEDLKQPEVVYTADQFVMIKEVGSSVPVLVQDSREEMECC